MFDISIPSLPGFGDCSAGGRGTGKQSMHKTIMTVASGVLAASAVLGSATGATAATAATTDELGFWQDHGGAVATRATQVVDLAAEERLSDGAYWTWGSGGIGGKTFSHYFRERSCHGATAVGKGTHRVSGVQGGRYAKAEVPSASSGNKAYYHNC